MRDPLKAMSNHAKDRLEQKMGRVRKLRDQAKRKQEETEEELIEFLTHGLMDSFENEDDNEKTI